MFLIKVVLFTKDDPFATICVSLVVCTMQVLITQRSVNQDPFTELAIKYIQVDQIWLCINCILWCNVHLIHYHHHVFCIMLRRFVQLKSAVIQHLNKKYSLHCHEYYSLKRVFFYTTEE